MNEKELIAFIVPTDFTGISVSLFGLKGTHNGYVAIPPGHPCHGVGYAESPVEDLEVHGGITLSEPVIVGEKNFSYGTQFRPEYMGKRDPILEDAEYITDDTDIPDDWWILGFDTCHWGDNPLKWNRERVIAETLRLKGQLKQFKYYGQ